MLNSENGDKDVVELLTGMNSQLGRFQRAGPSRLHRAAVHFNTGRVENKGE